MTIEKNIDYLVFKNQKGQIIVRRINPFSLSKLSIESTQLIRFEICDVQKRLNLGTTKQFAYQAALLHTELFSFNSAMSTSNLCIL